MQRLFFRSAFAIVLVALSLLPSLAIAPPASAGTCLSDIDGAGASGPLQTPDWLKTDYINASDWSGDNFYYAERHYSNGSISYSVTLYDGGSWEYGTSGNTYRFTAIDPGGGILFSWSVSQWQIC